MVTLIILQNTAVTFALNIFQRNKCYQILATSLLYVQTDEINRSNFGHLVNTRQMHLETGNTKAVCTRENKPGLK